MKIKWNWLVSWCVPSRIFVFFFFNSVSAFLALLYLFQLCQLRHILYIHMCDPNYFIPYFYFLFVWMVHCFILFCASLTLFLIYFILVSLYGAYWLEWNHATTCWKIPRYSTWIYLYIRIYKILICFFSFVYSVSYVYDSYVCARVTYVTSLCYCENVEVLNISLRDCLYVRLLLSNPVIQTHTKKTTWNVFQRQQQIILKTKCVKKIRHCSLLQRKY